VGGLAQSAHIGHVESFQAHWQASGTGPAAGVESLLASSCAFSLCLRLRDPLCVIAHKMSGLEDKHGCAQHSAFDASKSQDIVSSLYLFDCCCVHESMRSIRYLHLVSSRG
jgi:hypothetical protein